MYSSSLFQFWDEPANKKASTGDGHLVEAIIRSETASATVGGTSLIVYRWSDIVARSIETLYRQKPVETAYSYRIGR